MSHVENQRDPHERGIRAEQIASWYFRLNGFLSIPGFIVHPDQVREYPRTEADLIAVRFSLSQEIIAGRPMVDDALLTQLAPPDRRLFDSDAIPLFCLWR